MFGWMNINWMFRNRTLGAAALLAALSLGTAACEAEAGFDAPLLPMSGLDIHLPDGGALLDAASASGEEAPFEAALAPAAEARVAEAQAAVEGPAAGAPVVAPLATRPDEGLRAVPLPPADDPHFYERRYHVAWLRVTVPTPDGKAVVQQTFERQLGGETTWRAAPATRAPIR
ncbi:MAG: hypothetical protein H6747_15325 [Deltaproteobacteria bacterium]|nr:hypothetical protein [Deltaproteobacteria bacterium]